MEISNYGSFINVNDYRTNAAREAQNPERSFQDIMRMAGNNSDRSGAVVQQAYAPIDKNDELYQKCIELETFIVKNLLSGMRNTVQKSGLVDDSFAGQIYEDMLWDEYAKVYTENASFGLAESAYRQLKNYY